MLKLLILLIVFSLAACAGGRVNSNPEKTNDAMISFVQQAQAGFWKEAMENVTPEEREDMMDGNGRVMKEYRDAVNRIRLSTIKNMDLGLDGRGRLVGLRDVLDESNSFSRASDEKITIDPGKLKDLSIERKKREEEESKQLREDAEAPKAWGIDETETD